MKTFRAFGPTIGKGKLSRKFIDIINTQIDKSTITKKNDYSSKLASQASSTSHCSGATLGAMSASVIKCVQWLMRLAPL